MANSFGRDSELYIKTKAAKGATFLEDSFSTAPYKIAKPFYDDETGIMNIILMSASAGIMEGDLYRINMDLGDGSKTALLGQSHSKIHYMKEGYASQFNRFSLGEGAFFDYFQKPSIPFSNSRFHSVSECFLKEGSAFLYSEVLACGRVKMGECFKFKEYRNCNRVYYRDELIYVDNQALFPDEQTLNGIGFFEGYTHQALLAYFCDSFDDNITDRMFDILSKAAEIDFGVTRTERFGVVVRMMGNSSDLLEKVLTDLRKEIYGVVT